MSSTTNLVSHVIIASDRNRSSNHVCRDENDDCQEANVVLNFSENGPCGRSLTSNEIVAAVREYLRNVKQKTKDAFCENADTLLTTGVRVSGRTRPRPRGRKHKREKRSTDGRKKASKKTKKRAADEEGEFTGLKDRDRQPGHEYPCICDLSLPRKTLSDSERFRQGANNLRSPDTSSEERMSTLMVMSSVGDKAAVNVSEFTGLRDRDRQPGHEYPCICDLSLPRQSLSEEQRFKLGTAFLRSPSRAERRRVVHRKAKDYDAMTTAAPIRVRVRTAPRARHIPRPHTTKAVDIPEVVEFVHQPKRIAEPVQAPAMMRQASGTASGNEPVEMSGRPPQRSPPRLKLTVPQTPKKNQKRDDKHGNLGEQFSKKVHMNRAAYLRMEHTKYCGRGMTISLMGGARLKDEELALLKSKKEKSGSKAKNKKADEAKKKREEERARRLAEAEARKKEEAERKRKIDVLEGVECSYFKCSRRAVHRRKKKGKKPAK